MSHPGLMICYKCAHLLIPSSWTQVKQGMTWQKETPWAWCSTCGTTALSLYIFLYRGFLFLSLAVLLWLTGILHGALPQHFFFAGGEAFRSVSNLAAGTSLVPRACHICLQIVAYWISQIYSSCSLSCPLEILQVPRGKKHTFILDMQRL